MEGTNTISRRSFLAGAGLASATAIAGLAGCAPQGQGDGSDKTAPSDTLSNTGSSWRTPPAPIGDDQIGETISTEVAIVGAGISGCVAALTAAEAGLDAIVLQKTNAVLNYGSCLGTYDCKQQKENGAPDQYDVNELISEWMRYAMNIPDRAFMSIWRDRSGADGDWFYEALSDCDIEAPVWDWDSKPAILGSFSMIDAMPFITEKAEKAGVQFLYETPAVQLVRGTDNASGPVTAVIAQKKDGSYIKVEASKGILLCAGDYGNEPEMRAELLPHAEGFPSPYPEDVNTGDGIKMAVWVGAAVDQAPHCVNIHYDLVDGKLDQVFGSGIPWLRVNTNGERFSNEDVEYDYIPLQDARQPDHVHIDIFDADYDTYYPQMGDGLYRGYPTPEFCSPVYKQYLDENGVSYEGMTDYDAILEAEVHLGTAVRADTIEELAQQLGVPADTLGKTVDRYNELVAQGSDPDYGKPGKYLFPIKTPPFYGIRRQAYILSCLSGVSINHSSQVVDTNGDPIENLYACGINSGGQWFAGLLQPMDIPGLPCARSLITARMAIEDIASR